MPHGLMNRVVSVLISEPWELSTPAGGTGRKAVVKATHGGSASLLLELQEPVLHDKATYRMLVAVPRGHRPLVDTLAAGESAEADLYGIPEDRTPEDPFNLDWWRGGLGIVGTLTLSMNP
jgi:hypothetical protein